MRRHPRCFSSLFRKLICSTRNITRTHLTHDRFFQHRRMISRCNHFVIAFLIHEIEQTTDIVSNNIYFQCPRSIYITNDHRHIRYITYHHTVVKHMFTGVQWFMINSGFNTTHNLDFQTSCRDNDIRI